MVLIPTSQFACFRPMQKNFQNNFWWWSGKIFCLPILRRLWDGHWSRHKLCSSPTRLTINPSRNKRKKAGGNISRTRLVRALMRHFSLQWLVWILFKKLRLVDAKHFFKNSQKKEPQTLLSNIFRSVCFLWPEKHEVVLLLVEFIDVPLSAKHFLSVRSKYTLQLTAKVGSLKCQTYAWPDFLLLENATVMNS